MHKELLYDLSNISRLLLELTPYVVYELSTDGGLSHH